MLNGNQTPDLCGNSAVPTNFTVVCLVTWPVNESEAGVEINITKGGRSVS